MDKIVDKFVEIVLAYPTVNIQSLFNRYMHTLSEEEIEEIGEYFPVILRAGEAARNASPEMKQLIIQSMHQTSHVNA